MTTPVFPTGLFAFSVKSPDIEGATLSGGTALSGETDRIAADGGGRVVVEFSGGALVDRAQLLAWSALKSQIGDEVTLAVVPFCQIRLTPYGGGHSVPHSDGTPFSDGSLYHGGGPTAVAVDAAPLRAVSLRLAVTASQPLIGGEWFSVEHPTKGWRAYRIGSIDGDVVTFRPPLREAVDAGQHIELASPRCLMRQDGPTKTPTYISRQAEAAIRFVEAP